MILPTTLSYTPALRLLLCLASQLVLCLATRPMLLFVANSGQDNDFGPKNPVPCKTSKKHNCQLCDPTRVVLHSPPPLFPPDLARKRDNESYSRANSQKKFQNQTMMLKQKKNDFFPIRVALLFSICIPFLPFPVLASLTKHLNDLLLCPAI